MVSKGGEGVLGRRPSPGGVVRIVDCKSSSYDLFNSIFRPKPGGSARIWRRLKMVVTF